MIAASESAVDYWWLFPAIFVSMWLGISALLSLGGWHSLARNYRHPGKIEGRIYQLCSMSLGGTNYRSCILARLNAEGLALSVYLPFRFCHPNLFIPWTAVIECHRERYWLRNCTRLVVAGSRTKMRFYGSLGEAIHELRTRSL